MRNASKLYFQLESFQVGSYVVAADDVNRDNGWAMSTLEKPKRARNAAATKTKILAAARQAFSELGYANAGTRHVATLAGVSPTILRIYFGSKAGLFEAALRELVGLDEVLIQDRASFGINIVKLVIKNHENMRAVSMMNLAAADPDTRTITSRVLEESVIIPLAAWLGGAESKERALAISMLCNGFGIYAEQFAMLPRPLDPHHPCALWLAHSVQKIVDQSLTSIAANPSLPADGG